MKGETGKGVRGRYKVGMRVPGAECVCSPWGSKQRKKLRKPHMRAGRMRVEGEGTRKPFVIRALRVIMEGEEKG